MVKTLVKVVVRTRPTVEFASKNIEIDDATGKISVTIPKSPDKGYVNNQQDNWTFHLDKIFQNVSQEVIFDYCTKDIINSFLEGYSGFVSQFFHAK